MRPSCSRAVRILRFALPMPSPCTQPRFRGQRLTCMGSRHRISFSLTSVPRHYTVTWRCVWSLPGRQRTVRTRPGRQSGLREWRKRPDCPPGANQTDGKDYTFVFVVVAGRRSRSDPTVLVPAARRWTIELLRLRGTRRIRPSSSRVPPEATRLPPPWRAIAGLSCCPRRHATRLLPRTTTPQCVRRSPCIHGARLIGRAGNRYFITHSVKYRQPGTGILACPGPNIP